MNFFKTALSKTQPDCQVYFSGNATFLSAVLKTFKTIHPSCEYTAEESANLHSLISSITPCVACVRACSTFHTSPSPFGGLVFFWKVINAE